MNNDPDLRLYRAPQVGGDLVIGADEPTPNDDPNLAFYIEVKDGADLEFAGELPPAIKVITAEWGSNNQVAHTAFSAALRLSADIKQQLAPTSITINSALALPLTVNIQNKKVIAAAQAKHDINVERGPAIFATSSWLRTAALRAPETSIIVPKANRYSREPCAYWGGSLALHYKHTAPQRQMLGYEQKHGPRWQHGEHLGHSARQCINKLPLFNYQHALSWRKSLPLPTFAISGFSYPPKLHIEHSQKNGDLAALAKDICESFGLGAEFTFVFCANWHEARIPKPGKSKPAPPYQPEVKPELPPQENIESEHSFGDPTSPNLNLWLQRLPNGDLEFYRPARHEIPARKCYVITNTAFIVRSRDGVDIPATDVGIELDVDSWAWQFSATIPRLAALALAKSEQLTLHVNGHEWHAIVDSWQTARAWNSQEAIISGRSLSAELSPTHVLPVSVFEPAERSIIQLAEQALPDNWLLDWQAPDWLIPAGTFTAHNQTPIEILKTLAEAAGAYVRPHATERKLSVLSRYPTAPWLWAEQLMDVQIPPNIIVTTGSERVPGKGGDGVYISGGEQGVTTFVKRTGTAGAALLPMITNPLITDVSAATALGIIELARHQPHDLDSIEMPISSDTGLILPGTMIVADGMRGITRSLRVGASSQGKGLVVRQQLTVERHQ